MARPEAPSLQLRLLAGAAVWVSIALLCAGIAIVLMFRANLERNAEADLSAAMTRLIALAQFGPEGGVALSGPLPDPRYERPLSGFYWQVDDVLAGTQVRSRSLWDVVLAPPAEAAGAGLVVVAGPSGQSLSALVRQVISGTGAAARPYRFLVAEDRAVLEQSLSRFSGELAGAFVVLGLALIGAAWLQVRIGLLPLGALKRGVEAVRRGEATDLPGAYPAELLPLVGEVNDLLRTQEQSIGFARARASDLAHGLKTPLQVLGGLGERARGRGDAETGREIEALAAEMRSRIDYQLRLSRLRMRPRSHALSSELRPAIERVLGVIRRTERGERLSFEVEAPAGLAADIDASDLVELLGVLLENAARWSRSRVTIGATTEADRIVLSIADDGPGLSDADMARVKLPGETLDAKGGGSGLGLPIAFEIAQINGGEIALGRSTEGGLLVIVRLLVAETSRA